MREDIIVKIIKEAEYVIQTGATVRETARVFGTGKSTVHKDITERLKGVDGELFLRVRAVLEKNLAERHIRGGEATRKKYSAVKRVAITLDKPQ